MAAAEQLALALDAPPALRLVPPPVSHISEVLMNDPVLPPDWPQEARRLGDSRDYWECAQARYEATEPRPCPKCHRTDQRQTTRTVELRKGVRRSILWWYCDACDTYGDPVAEEPRDTLAWYLEQLQPRRGR